MVGSLNSSKGARLGDSDGLRGEKQGLVGWVRGSSLSWSIEDGACLVAHRGESEVGTQSRSSVVGMQPTHSWAGLGTTERVSPPRTARSVSPVWCHRVPAFGGRGEQRRDERRRQMPHYCQRGDHSLGQSCEVLLAGKGAEAAGEAGSSHPRLQWDMGPPS